jgi:hypothetical protein
MVKACQPNGPRVEWKYALRNNPTDALQGEEFTRGVRILPRGESGDPAVAAAVIFSLNFPSFSFQARSLVQQFPWFVSR